MYRTPLLSKTYKLFQAGSEEALRKTYIFGCQHILEPKEKMFAYFAQYGIPKENIHIIGKAYSTNDQLLSELQQQGFHIEQPPFRPQLAFDIQHAENCEKLFRLFQRMVPSGATVIVLDDGGQLLQRFHEDFASIPHTIRVYGVEQTSSGFRKLEGVPLKFPIINVARSRIKLTKESTFIANSCLSRLQRAVGPSYLQKRFFIIGQGPIGKAITSGLRRMGVRQLQTYDVRTHTKSIELFIQEYRPEVIIGTSGHNSLTRESIETLSLFPHPVYLASASSSDREFAVHHYRTKLEAWDVHSQVAYKNIIFCNNGFPINFTGERRSGPISGIERTICLLLGSVLYWTTQESRPRRRAGFIPVPKIVQVYL